MFEELIQLRRYYTKYPSLSSINKGQSQSDFHILKILFKGYTNRIHKPIIPATVLAKYFTKATPKVY
jgi:hypothetical protein